MAHVADLIRAATTHRDRALWLLLSGAGLRTSEALNLKWPHIDFAAQKIFLEDPNGLRHTAELLRRSGSGSRAVR